MLRRTPLRKVSKKHAKELAEYSVKAKAYKLRYPTCFLCSAPTKDVHHVHGRGKHLMDESTWIPVCRACHNGIHAFPGEARRRGLLA